MKYLLTTIIMCVALIAGAQEYKVAHNGGKLILEGVDDVKIEAYDGSEVIFSINSKKDHKESERAAGLKPINSLGLEDNTDIGLSVSKDGENLKAIQIGQCMCRDNEGYTIKIPKSMGIDYSHSTYDSDHLRIKNVNKEIVVSTNYTNINLEDVTGPMSIKTVYGDIEAKFASLNQNSSVSLNSVYGFVDAAIPSTSKARLNLRTPYGQIYTDFDIKVETTDGMRSLTDKKIEGTVNNGGVDLILKSGYENIYLRKK
ncbi:DUF4097 family beta strand repeat-containing protein [Portibacter lacus]|uniref:DUF4097 domain-containing protein n=1 Tax=Portibacter lacus TaxID=1099794 RepID=A0AA37WDW8_9BACT|nr:DUF4097 family beta strand repeat-containing protein [Portibacter lacus]GLR17353.1 hypothetical protein GCM10007940_19680 [Portibacter lacus]